jgi:hypothetical protein
MLLGISLLGNAAYWKLISNFVPENLSGDYFFLLQEFILIGTL